MIVFKTPLVLLLLILMPVVAGMLWHQKTGSFVFSSISFFKNRPLSWRMEFLWVPTVLRIIALILMIIALAGPRKPLGDSQIQREGIYMMLVLDVSTSMAIRDFKDGGKLVSRLQIVKKVLADFIEKRKNDQLGLIAFAAKPYTVCPLTADHGWILAQLKRVDFGLMQDGTAIGSAVASAVNRLRSIDAKTKVIVLLTDGVNNAGSVDPLDAAMMANVYGIKIYTIGAGSKEVQQGQAIRLGSFSQHVGRVEIDEEILESMAERTDGKYFRATDTESLQNIYRMIDRLEKTKIEDVDYREYQELFFIFLFFALLCILLEIILSRTILLRIP